MPRQKKKKVEDKPLANQQKGNKVCNYCHQEKKLTDFYLSKSPIHSADSRIPICKECVCKTVLDEDGTINDLELNKFLKLIDRPYYKDLLESSVNSFRKANPYIDEDKVKYYGKYILGKYFTLICMRQEREKTYADSERDGFVHPNRPKTVKEEIAMKYADLQKMDEKGETRKQPELLQKHYAKLEDFQVTPEIIDLFGDGYTTEEYKKMHEKYEKLKLNYALQTNLHQESLVTYVRFKVKEEIATASGNVDEAKKWYDAAQNAAEKGKLTPRQLTQADLQGGINSFSEIFKAVEQAIDIIPILPQFKYRPNDACDFIIWCYINYARDLQGLPPCEYEDVYKFYDRKKEEYISQYGDPYGIFDDDPSEKLRPNIEKFITLPKDYEDTEES